MVQYKWLKHPVPLQRRATFLNVEAKRPGRQNKEPEVAKTQQKQLAKLTVGTVSLTKNLIQKQYRRAYGN